MRHLPEMREHHPFGGAGDFPLLAAPPAVWDILRQQLEDQLATGVYPIGSWLPSVRELAARYGINRNTVSKVYRELERRGLVESVRGKGVRVTAERSGLTSREARLAQAFAALVREANRLDLPSTWVLRHVQEALRISYGDRRLEVGLVECHEQGTRDLCDDLARHLGIAVHPIVLHHLAEDPLGYAQKFDIIATTLFHLQEVNSLLSGLAVEVVGINHAVSFESILQIARFRPDATIAVICPNQRTLDRVQRIVQTYARGEILGQTTEDEKSARQVLDRAELAIDTKLSHPLVRQHRPELPTITVTFHIEEQSITYLTQVIRRHCLSPAVTPGIG